MGNSSQKKKTTTQAFAKKKQHEKIDRRRRFQMWRRRKWGLASAAYAALGLFWGRRRGQKSGRYRPSRLLVNAHTHTHTQATSSAPQSTATFCLLFDLVIRPRTPARYPSISRSDFPPADRRPPLLTRCWSIVGTLLNSMRTRKMIRSTRKTASWKLGKTR